MSISIETLKALETARARLQKQPEMSASMISAGFIYDDETKETGVQIFVKVARFDARLLAADIETGGLLCGKEG